MSLGIADKYENFVKNAKAMVLSNIISNVVALIVLLVLIYILVQKVVAKPLILLSGAFEKLSNYDFRDADDRQKLVHYIRFGDEIADIIKAGEKMSDNVKNLLVEISQNAQNVAATSEKLTATSQTTLNSATEEIRKVIEGLKRSTQEAVDNMTQVGSMIGDQMSSADETQVNFTQIADAVSDSENIIDKITAYASDIVEKNNNVVSVVENLSAIGKENAATTQEANASVETQTQSIHNIIDTSETWLKICKSKCQNSKCKFEK